MTYGIRDYDFDDDQDRARAVARDVVPRPTEVREVPYVDPAKAIRMAPKLVAALRLAHQFLHDNCADDEPLGTVGRTLVEWDKP